MNSVKENALIVRENIETACARSQRQTEEINVIAVTKYVDTERMKETLAAGFKHIGENRAQDVLQKWDPIGFDATWHFIGHLQTNKVKYMIDKCQYVHSLDRLSLAKRLHQQAEKVDRQVSSFVQVNIAQETSKHGLYIDEVSTFIEQLADFPRLKVIGLMTMAPYYEDPEQARPIFHRLKELQLQLQSQYGDYAPLTECSMGMSNDYQVAIEEGATYIRLGSCLVGKNM